MTVSELLRGLSIAFFFSLSISSLYFLAYVIYPLKHPQELFKLFLGFTFILSLSVIITNHYKDSRTCVEHDIQVYEKRIQNVNDKKNYLINLPENQRQVFLEQYNNEINYYMKQLNKRIDILK